MRVLKFQIRQTMLLLALILLMGLVPVRAIYGQENVTDLNGSEESGDETAEITATKAPLVKCAIVYLGLGGADNSRNLTEYTSRKKYTLKTPVRAGYKFLGWYEEVDGTLVKRKSIKRTVESNDVITLTAKWTPIRYKIKYKMKNCVSVENPVYYTIEDSAIIFRDPKLKAGLSFEGWYQDKRCTVPISSIEAGSTGKRTIYGKYAPIRYTVHFDANGGYGNKTFADVECTYGTKFTIPMVYALKGKGSDRYTAVGFNTKADGSGDSYKSLQKVSNIAKRNGDMTLYIEWKRVSDEEREAAAKVVELMNAERRKAGLSTLDASSDDFSNIAMQRARDLTVSFSHARPDKLSIGSWLRTFRLPYYAAGENIAAGQSSAERVMNTWMNSSGHKSNILSRNFNRVAVGCHIEVDANGYKRYYWVQDFVGY